MGKRTSVNIAAIYNKVKQRAYRAVKDNEPAVLHAVRARALAKRLIEMPEPTLDAVFAFEQAENVWLELRGQEYRHGPLASEFRNAIASGRYHVKRSTVNTFASGYELPNGYVYVARSTAPGKRRFVKIGLANDLDDRIVTLRKRYKDPSIRAVFGLQVNKPASVEELAGVLLEAVRVPRAKVRNSMEWFECTTASAIDAIERAARELGHEITWRRRHP